MNTITIQQLQSNQSSKFGMVALGAGGNPQEWADGISEMLKKEKIVEFDVPTFESFATLTGNLKGKNGRTDLVLYFNHESKVKVGKLAIWRLVFGDISWTDDFVANYGKDYGLLTAINIDEEDYQNQD